MNGQTHSMPIDERIAWLLDHARRHSEAFRSPEAWLARKLYRADHPTLMIVLKCMDGRINIPVATRTSFGRHHHDDHTRRHHQKRRCHRHHLQLPSSLHALAQLLGRRQRRVQPPAPGRT